MSIVHAHQILAHSEHQLLSLLLFTGEHSRTACERKELCAPQFTTLSYRATLSRLPADACLQEYIYNMSGVH